MSKWMILFILLISSCTHTISHRHWSRCVKSCKDMGGLKEAGGKIGSLSDYMCCRCNDGTKVELLELPDQDYEEPYVEETHEVNSKEYEEFKRFKKFKESAKKK